MDLSISEMRVERKLKNINDILAASCKEIKPINGMQLYHFRIPCDCGFSDDELERQFAPIAEAKAFSRIQAPVSRDIISVFPLLIFKDFDAVFFKECFIVRFYVDKSHNLVENQG